MTMKVKMAHLKDFFERAHMKNLVPCILSNPGFGKSESVRKYAEENGYILYEVQVAGYQPWQLGGIPIELAGKSTIELRPVEGIFPLDTDDFEGKIPLVFLDEVSNSDQDMRKVLMRLILDRKIGENIKLHPDSLMICAGNLGNETDQAEPLEEVLTSRMVMAELDFSAKDYTAPECDYKKYIEKYIKTVPKVFDKVSPRELSNYFNFALAKDNLNDLHIFKSLLSSEAQDELDISKMIASLEFAVREKVAKADFEELINMSVTDFFNTDITKVQFAAEYLKDNFTKISKTKAMDSHIAKFFALFKTSTNNEREQSFKLLFKFPEEQDKIIPAFEAMAMDDIWNARKLYAGLRHLNAHCKDDEHPWINQVVTEMDASESTIVI